MFGMIFREGLVLVMDSDTPRPVRGHSRVPILTLRLRDARRERGLRQRELAGILGVQPNTISRWEKGTSVPDILSVMGLAYLFDKPHQWFYGEAEADVVPDVSGPVSLVRERVDALVNLIFVGAEARRLSLESILGLNVDGGSGGADVGASHFVSLHPLQAAAGAGADVIGDGPVEHVRVERQFLRDHALQADQCDLNSVSGDSMHPTLPDGSMILVDRSSRNLLEGRVFVLQTPDGLLVKRVRQEGARWLLVSDNPDWEAFPLDTGSRVIGEVRWSGLLL